MVGMIVLSQVTVQKAQSVIDVITGQDVGGPVTCEVVVQDFRTDMADHSMVVSHVEDIMSICLHVEDLMGCKWVYGGDEDEL